MKTTKFILVTLLLSVTMYPALSLATHDYRYNISGGNCHVADESDKDCIYYSSYGYVINKCENDDVAVNCEIGQLVLMDGGELTKVYDADFYYVDAEPDDAFTCYLFSRDSTGITFNYAGFSDNDYSISVQHKDLNTIYFYEDDDYAPMYVTCWIPRDALNESKLLTISVGMRE